MCWRSPGWCLRVLVWCCLRWCVRCRLEAAELGRMDPLPGNQRSWGAVTHSRLVCFPLRFFRRDYVASLGNLPQRGSTPYGHNSPPKGSTPASPPRCHSGWDRQSARVNGHSMSFGRRSASPRPPPRERAGGPPHVGAAQAPPGPRDPEEAVRFGLHRPLFRPDPPPLAKRWRFDHLFGGVRCKVVGEWGGSAH